MRAPQLLDISRDVHRLEEPELGQPPALAPAEEAGHRLGVGGARVAVADVGGEEFEKTAARVGAGGGDLGRDEGVGFADEEVICHEDSVASFRKKQSHKGRYGMGSSVCIKSLLGWPM